MDVGVVAFGAVSDAAAGLVGALVGGLAALGGAVVQARATERSERARREAATLQARDETDRRRAEAFRVLAQRYLFQLSDAAESLDKRLKNWTLEGGAGLAEHRDPGYWQITTLYAIGRALAAERILDLEGVYVQIEEAFGRRLERRQVEGAIERAMKDELFYYHRLALAESILERGPDGFRLLVYTEFRRRYTDPAWRLDVLLEPAITALTDIAAQKLTRLRRDLTSVRKQLDEVMRPAQPSEQAVGSAT